VRPFVLNDLQAERRSEDGRDGREEGGRTDLDVLVERIARSARRRGAPSPRCPWPHPLPPEVTWATLGPAAPAHVPLGLVDDPDHQVRRVYTWPQSNLLACGAAGSGAVDAVATLAYALASRPGGGDVHVYALDGAARPLAGLGALPHTGAVIEDHDAERRRRLLRILGDRVDNAARGAPMVLLAIAEMTALFAALDDPASPRARELLVRIIADGPAAGVFTAAAVTRPAAVPPAIAAGFATRLVFRLADPHDASLLGVRPPPPNAPPGRAVDVGSGLEVQMAAPEPPGAAVTERPAAPPPPVSILSASINWATGVAPAAASPPGPGVWLPIGIGDDTLEPCGLLLGDGDHVVVAGGPRTGKTGLLATIARAAASAGVAVTADVAAARAASGHRLCLLVVDDADLIDDANGEVAALLGCRPSSVHVVAAARTERLRGAYGHWTRELRGARHGVLLGPRPDDGDVFGLVLPRTTAPFPPGRGYLITNGIPQLFQAASV
jgi:S-DNA-T family DNA segregation ATPase FtsK/SpoIIIE